ncbi:hypothetical protein [Burkholderia sp. MSMB1835]|uniref:hypothetical protein n=1 Tax=Burkholderia sp. MSMB1835 TaxID=1637876 RepID=UPI000B1E3F2F|nr:hypothetical protein [Burkholderia sp. MSMB1835]
MPIAGMRAAAEHRVSIGLRAIVQVEAGFDAKLRMLAAAEILVAAAQPEDRIRQAAALQPRDPPRVSVRTRVFESTTGECVMRVARGGGETPAGAATGRWGKSMLTARSRQLPHASAGLRTRRESRRSALRNQQLIEN